ncbi:MAG TPA: triose-phosphate isomerase [Candidatus Binataceae bacterium]|nr:triose-phosphate isomerase [Candidatus Binataceae bacterium]
MRKKLIAANWKMNMTPASALELIAALRANVERDARDLLADREALVAPPAILIPAVAEALKSSPILLGAQNMHYEEKGAFTGEISPLMLKAFGVTHVILGHSERRHIFGENDILIGKKVRSAINHGLVPILCIGETQEEHDRGRAIEVVLRQMEGGLADVTNEEAAGIILAYEPVWAIGTGRTATPQQAESIHGALRGAFNERFGHDPAQVVQILYGGSVNDENVDSLLSKPDIDGALVGTASLKADSFARIVRAQTH